MTHEVLLYYRYAPVADPEAWAVEHRLLCAELELKGRIIVAKEGLNGTVSGVLDATAAYRRALLADPVFEDVEFKAEPVEGHAFARMTVKVRDEIVSLGLEQDLDPLERTGTYLEPVEFREMLRRAAEDRDVVVLDGRNDYESALGHFEGAVCPAIENFRDFPQWLADNRQHFEGKKILTYCTGGIRCEKLSGLMLREGFEEVYQLHGGIIRYGQDEEVKGDGFEGECYVFDDRVQTRANFTESARVVSHCVGCSDESVRYRNCAWPPCNDQFFLCEACEEKAGGRYCSPECQRKHG